MIAPYSKPLESKLETWDKAIELLIQEGYNLIRDPFTGEFVYCNLSDVTAEEYIVIDSWLMQKMLREIVFNVNASWDAFYYAQLFLKDLKNNRNW